MSKRGYTVTETTPGNVNVTCDISGRPFTRTTMLGMFCDAEVCQCEQKSKQFMDNLPPGLSELFK